MLFFCKKSIITVKKMRKKSENSRILAKFWCWIRFLFSIWIRVCITLFRHYWVALKSRFSNKTKQKENPQKSPFKLISVVSYIFKLSCDSRFQLLHLNNKSQKLNCSLKNRVWQPGRWTENNFEAIFWHHGHGWEGLFMQNPIMCFILVWI